MANSKVKFGLKNVHYAKVTETVTTTGDTVTSYSAVLPWSGAVSLSLSSNASKSVFRADNEDYFISYGLQSGYEGTLESALVPEDIKIAVLGYRVDDNGILVEDSASMAQTNYIAMMFEIDGDAEKTMHCLYKVSLSRPDIASQTTGENGQIDPQTESLNLTAVPRPDDNLIHVETGSTADSSVRAAWYTSVPIPTFTPNP